MRDHTSIPGLLDLKNQVNVARWRWRWHLQGGSSSWTARPLQDLRNEEDLRRYREIEFDRRHTPFGRRVVNINAWKFERIRQKRYRRMVTA